MWGISPTLGWYTRVKTHVHATVFVNRVASLTRPRIDLSLGKPEHHVGYFPPH